MTAFKRNSHLTPFAAHIPDSLTLKKLEGLRGGQIGTAARQAYRDATKAMKTVAVKDVFKRVTLKERRISRAFTTTIAGKKTALHIWRDPVSYREFRLVSAGTRGRRSNYRARTFKVEIFRGKTKSLGRRGFIYRQGGRGGAVVAFARTKGAKYRKRKKAALGAASRPMQTLPIIKLYGPDVLSLVAPKKPTMRSRKLIRRMQTRGFQVLEKRLKSKIDETFARRARTKR